MTGRGPGRCWRVRLDVRIGMGLAIVATGAIAVISTVRKDFPISDPLTMIVGDAAVWWFFVLRPAVSLTAGELVVRNPLRTHRIARGDVASAMPGSYGTVISRRDGRRCTALALWTRRRTKAERAAGLINSWAQTPPSSDRGEAADSPYRPGSWIRRHAVDLVAAAGLAVAFTVPAALQAWAGHSRWVWPVGGLVMFVAFLPLTIPRPERDAFAHEG